MLAIISRDCLCLSRHLGQLGIQLGVNRLNLLKPVRDPIGELLELAHKSRQLRLKHLLDLLRGRHGSSGLSGLSGLKTYR